MADTINVDNKSPKKNPSKNTGKGPKKNIALAYVAKIAKQTKNRQEQNRHILVFMKYLDTLYQKDYTEETIKNAVEKFKKGEFNVTKDIAYTGHDFYKHNRIRDEYLDLLQTRLPYKLYVDLAHSIVTNEETDLDEVTKQFIKKYDQKGTIVSKALSMLNKTNGGDGDGNTNNNITASQRKKDIDVYMIDDMGNKQLTTFKTLKDQENIYKNIPNPFNSCVNNYYSVKWINDRVKGVYISSVNNTDISLYVNGKMSKFINNREWFIVTEKYIKMICLNKYTRKQKGDVMTIEGPKFKMELMVGFDITDDKFIIQDEKIFRDEIEYMNRFDKYVFDRIEELKNVDVVMFKDKILSLASVSITSTLIEIAPNNDKYGKLNDISPFVSQVVDILFNSSHKIGDFSKKLATLMTYISNDVIDNKNEFQHKIIEGLYTPEILCLMNLPEVLPEIFVYTNIDEKIKNNITKYINVLIDEYSDMFVKSLYYIINDSERRTNATKQRPIVFIPKYETSEKYNEKYNEKYIKQLKNGNVSILNTIKNTCSNKDTVKNIDIAYLTSYKSYCYDVRELMKKFKNNDFSDNVNGGSFDDDFVSKVSKLDIKQVGIRQRSSSSGEKMIAPGLIDTFFDLIDDIENEQNEQNEQNADNQSGNQGNQNNQNVDDKGNDKAEHVQDEYDQDSSDVDWYDDLTTDDVAFIDKSINKRVVPEASISDSDGESPSLMIVDGVNNNNGMHNTNVMHNTPQTIDPKKCVNCSKYLTDNVFKSKVIDNNNELKTVMFCSTNCFEKYSEWKKPRKSKKSKKL
jgi:hypothetical protein